MEIPKKPFILYFVDGAIAKPQDRLDAEMYAIGQVQYRNAKLVVNVEAGVDGVAGAVPPLYKDHPSAEQAIEAYSKKLIAARKKTGDKQAPKPVKQSSEMPELGQEEEKPPTPKPVPKPVDKK